MPLMPSNLTLAITLLTAGPTLLCACTGEHTEQHGAMQDHKKAAPAAMSKESTTAIATNALFPSNSAALQATEFLPVEQAFRLSAELDKRAVTLIWHIEPEYYLYKHQFKFSTDNASIENTLMNSGVMVNDEEYGNVEVFYHQAVIEVQLPQSFSKGTLSVKSQGCADAGLCYPPQTSEFKVDIIAATITQLN